MKRRSIVLAMAVLSLASGGAALAEKDGATNDEGLPAKQPIRNRLARTPVRPGNQGRPSQGRPRQDVRRDDRRDERGAGPERAFHRGDRLPPEYRHRSYVVDDWRGHGLPPPPRGHYWVQSGTDYLLIAIATGVILEILLNN